MFKPPYKHSPFHTSTAANSLQAHTTHNTTTLHSRTTISQTIPTSTYHNPPPVYRTQPPPESNFDLERYPITTQSQDQIETNTKVIQDIITSAIQADIERSYQRDIKLQKFIIGPERTCAFKPFAIPTEVYAAKESRQNQGNAPVHMICGQLPYANAIFYIIQNHLFVFSVHDLLERDRAEANLKSGSSSSKSTHFNPQLVKPIQIKENCNNIHEVIFYQENEISLIKVEKRTTLVLEYPYHLEFINYCFNSGSSEQHANEFDCRIKQFTPEQTAIKINLESRKAEFLTVTLANSFLYLDENGELINLNLFENDRRFRTTYKKKNFALGRGQFVSKHRNWKQRFQDVAEAIDCLSFSMYNSIKANKALVYDEMRSKVFTLTKKGDRSTRIQVIKQEINVYNFFPINNGKIQHILQIPERQLLIELGYNVDKTPYPVSISTIVKAHADYNQTADLIILMTNGTKHWLQIESDKDCRFFYKCGGPSVKDIEAITEQKENILEQCRQKRIGNLAFNQMQKIWANKVQVKALEDKSQRIYASLNDRSLSIGLVKVDEKMAMYMTSKKNENQEAFLVKFKCSLFTQKGQVSPDYNKIFEMKGMIGKESESKRSRQLTNMEAIQEVKRVIHSKGGCNFIPSTKNCHELVRQVHHGPRHFTYINNNFIGNFIFSRPIDLLYCYVSTTDINFLQNYLCDIMQLPEQQISCMLLQIYLSDPQKQKFLISKNQKQKIQYLIKNKNPHQRQQQNYQNQFYQNYHQTKSQIKKIDQQPDQLIDLGNQPNYPEYKIFKDKIKNLFEAFSKIEQKKNTNIFSNIKIHGESTSYYSGYQKDKIFENLQPFKIVQAKNCLLYISRALYPFWQAKTLSHESSKDYLTTLKEIVEPLFKLEELLEKLSNDFHKPLKQFLQKLMAIIEVFKGYQNISEDLTIKSAMKFTKNYLEGKPENEEEEKQKTETQIVNPDLPFSQAMKLCQKKIQSQKERIDSKLKYLKQMKKRIDNQKSSSFREKQSITPSQIRRFQAYYEKTFKIVKFQKEFIQIGEMHSIKQIREDIEEEIKKGSGIVQTFKKFKNFVVELFSFQDKFEPEQSQEDSQTPQEKAKNIMKKLYGATIQALDRRVLSEEQLQNQVKYYKLPYLKILFLYTFNLYKSQGGLKTRSEELKNKFRQLFESAFIASDNSDTKNMEKNYESQLNSIHSNIFKVISFLNSVDVQFQFSQIYEPFIDVLSKNPFTFEVLKKHAKNKPQNDFKHLYLPNQWPFMNFNERRIANFIMQRIYSFVGSQSVNPNQINKIVLEICLLVDLISKHCGEKSSDLHAMVSVIFNLIQKFMKTCEKAIQKCGLYELVEKKERLLKELKDKNNVEVII